MKKMLMNVQFASVLEY